MKKMLGIAAAVAALSVSGAAQSALVIDLFSVDQATITDATIGDGAVFSVAGSAGETTIIGGYRELGVELKQQLQAGADVDIGVASGYLSFSTASLAAATGLVRWDGSPTATANGSLIGDPTNFLLGADLSGFTNFELFTIFSDGDYFFSLELYTSATQWSKILLPATATPITIPDGVKSVIPLFAFLDCGGVATCGAGGAVNLAAVGAMQGIIDPLGSKVSLDLTLNQVTAVPEPASLALVGLGLLGLGAMRRRRA